MKRNVIAKRIGALALSAMMIAPTSLVLAADNGVVYMNDTKITGNILIDKANTKVLVSGNTNIPSIEFTSYATLTSEDFTGTVDQIVFSENISLDNQTQIDVDVAEIIMDATVAVTVAGNVGKITITETSKDVEITVLASATVDSIVANANVTLKGNGKITELEANADDITIASGITAGDIVIADGITSPTTSTTTSSGGSSSSSSSSSSSGNGGSNSDSGSTDGSEDSSDDGSDEEEDGSEDDSDDGSDDGSEDDSDDGSDDGSDDKEFTLSVDGDKDTELVLGINSDVHLTLQPTGVTGGTITYKSTDASVVDLTPDEIDKTKQVVNAIGVGDVRIIATWVSDDKTKTKEAYIDVTVRNPAAEETFVAAVDFENGTIKLTEDLGDVTMPMNTGKSISIDLDGYTLNSFTVTVPDSAKATPVAEIMAISDTSLRNIEISDSKASGKLNSLNVESGSTAATVTLSAEVMTASIADVKDVNLSSAIDSLEVQDVQGVSLTGASVQSISVLNDHTSETPVETKISGDGTSELHTIQTEKNVTIAADVSKIATQSEAPLTITVEDTYTVDALDTTNGVTVLGSGDIGEINVDASEAEATNPIPVVVTSAINGGKNENIVNVSGGDADSVAAVQTTDTTGGTDGTTTELNLTKKLPEPKVTLVYGDDDTPYTFVNGIADIPFGEKATLTLTGYDTDISLYYLEDVSMTTLVVEEDATQTGYYKLADSAVVEVKDTTNDSMEFAALAAKDSPADVHSYNVVLAQKDLNDTTPAALDETVGKPSSVARYFIRMQAADLKAFYANTLITETIEEQQLFKGNDGNGDPEYYNPDTDLDLIETPYYDMEAFKEYYDKMIELLEDVYDPATTQSEIDSFVDQATTLNDGILAEKLNRLSMQVVGMSMSTAEANKNDYTTESFTAYEEAITLAEAMPELSQANIDAKTEAFSQALDLLVIDTSEPTDPTVTFASTQTGVAGQLTAKISDTEPVVSGQSFPKGTEIIFNFTADAAPESGNHIKLGDSVTDDNAETNGTVSAFIFTIVVGDEDINFDEEAITLVSVNELELANAKEAIALLVVRDEAFDDGYGVDLTSCLIPDGEDGGTAPTSLEEFTDALTAYVEDPTRTLTEIKNVTNAINSGLSTGESEEFIAGTLKLATVAGVIPHILFFDDNDIRLTTLLVGQEVFVKYHLAEADASVGIEWFVDGTSVQAPTASDTTDNTYVVKKADFGGEISVEINGGDPVAIESQNGTLTVSGDGTISLKFEGTAPAGLSYSDGAGMSVKNGVVGDIFSVETVAPEVGATNGSASLSVTVDGDDVVSVVISLAAPDGSTSTKTINEAVEEAVEAYDGEGLSGDAKELAIKIVQGVNISFGQMNFATDSTPTENGVLLEPTALTKSEQT
ncbi:MAG: hypothetical protein R3Y53_08915 [Bacillota bacterium]